MVHSCRLWCVSGGFSLQWQIAWLLQMGGTLLGVAKQVLGEARVHGGAYRPVAAAARTAVCLMMHLDEPLPKAFCSAPPAYHLRLPPCLIPANTPLQRRPCACSCTQESRCPTRGLSLALPDLFDQSCLVPQSQALRLIMHLGEPLPEARPAWEFPMGATLPFFLLTFAIMCYTNGVGASTGGCCREQHGLLLACLATWQRG